MADGPPAEENLRRDALHRRARDPDLDMGGQSRLQQERSGRSYQRVAQQPWEAGHLS